MRFTRKERIIPFIVGLVALFIITGWFASTWFYKKYNVTVWRPPGDTLKPDNIVPVLTLLELQGVGTPAIFWNALDKKEIETAYATLVYAINLEPATRSSLALQLAHEAKQNKRIQRSSYQIAALTAIAAPDLSDLTRSTTLLQVGEGLAELGYTADALFYLDQVYEIARHSTQMDLAHRRVLIDQLIPLYQQLGRLPEEWQALVDEIYTQTVPEPEITTPVRLTRPQFFAASNQALQAMAARQQMVEHILQSTSSTLTQYQAKDLAAVLQHEDQIRQQDYDTIESKQELLDYAAWMMLKFRIAHQGFGLSLVPDWENQSTEIEGQLKATLDALYQTEQNDVAAQTILLWQLEHGLLGFYPDWSVAEWTAQFEQVTKPTLHVAVRVKNQSTYFFLSGEPEF